MFWVGEVRRPCSMSQLSAWKWCLLKTQLSPFHIQPLLYSLPWSQGFAVWNVLVTLAGLSSLQTVLKYATLHHPPALFCRELPDELCNTCICVSFPFHLSFSCDLPTFRCFDVQISQKVPVCRLGVTCWVVIQGERSGEIPHAVTLLMCKIIVIKAA